MIEKRGDKLVYLGLPKAAKKALAVAAALPEPFGYVGPSMLRRGPPGTSPTFMGTYDKAAGVDFEQTALYTEDQLRAALADIVDTWRASLAADDAEALRVLGETIERYENLVEKRG